MKHHSLRRLVASEDCGSTSHTNEGVVSTTLVTTTYSQLINKATDENKPLEGTRIEIQSIKSLAYATEVAKNLSTAVRDMCPSCVKIVQKALSEEEEATIHQHVEKGDAG